MATKKLLEAKKIGQDSVSFWGTGTATRDFLLSDDLADYVIKNLINPTQDNEIGRAHV